MQPHPHTAEKTVTLQGGKDVSITRLDGATETVFVKQLPARLMPDYAKSQVDEVAMIKLATDKNDHFCDSLTPDSHEALIAAVEEVNADFFQRWSQRLKARAERFSAGAAKAPAKT